MAIGDINLVYGLPCTYNQLMEILSAYEYKYRRYKDLEETIQSRIRDDFTELKWKWGNDILDDLRPECEFSVELWGFDDESIRHTFEVFRFPHPHSNKKRPFAVVGVLVDSLKYSDGYQSSDLNLSIETLEQIRRLWMDFPTGCERQSSLQMFSIPDGCGCCT